MTLNPEKISFYPAIDWLVNPKVQEQTKRLSSEFNAAPDTCLFYEGIFHASQLARSLFPQERLKMVDIGCNSGVPDIVAIKRGIIQSSLGIELSSKAVKKGERIRHLLGIGSQQMQFLNLSMLDEKAETLVKKYRPHLVAGNLPYLPSLPNSPLEVSGGPDGTLYVPSVMLRYGALAKAPVITMSLCSLVDVKKVIGQIEDSSYCIYEALLLSHPFGVYTQRLHETGLLERMSYTPYYFTDQNQKLHQLVINLVLIDRKLSSGQKLNPNQIIKALENYKAKGNTSSPIQQPTPSSI